jgi:DNA-binding NarL/FixJ family response regulator
MRFSGHRCLIVDDSPTFCAAVRDMLQTAGMTVVGTASTLAAAVEATTAHDPDLILVDIELGDESGFDVVEALHARATSRRPAVILVSTHHRDDFAELIEESSAIGFLPKFGLSAEAIAETLARHPQH